MNSLKLALVSGTFLLVGCLVPSAAFAGTICPSFTGDPIVGTTGCNVLITAQSGGTLAITYPDLLHPYDGTEDQLIGVTNNSGSAITAITLTGIIPIFHFDGDGIDTKVPGTDPMDPTKYGGPDGYFTGINGARTVGTLNFSTPLGNGLTTYFSLEFPPTGGSITGRVGGQTPEPSSLILLGTAGLGMVGAFRRRFLN